MVNGMELTILMPCLNEAETVGACVKKALRSIDELGLKGEVLVADNGSTDGSIQIAENLGARVVRIEERGYGSALRGGIEAARGAWIIMGDADDSYDFSRLGPFVEKFKEGYELVMGCRMPRGGGTIMPGAMPWKNRYVGNPALSFLGRMFFKCPAADFHCGLRGFTREAFQKMGLRTTGMEFASEMVIKATLKQMKIAEIPITLHKDGRLRPPHLKPWRDGWRHLRFMLLYSPRWLFLMPGLVLSLLGLLASGILAVTPVKIGGVMFDAGTMVVACMTTIIGVELMAFAFFTKTFAITEGLLPEDSRFSRLFRYFNLERGVILGLAILVMGGALVLRGFWIWGQVSYGSLSYSENMRRLIPATTLIVIGIQTIFSSFFMSVLGLKMVSRHPPQLPGPDSSTGTKG
jgi:glycosyltransferase involved in cell wall biosynthesis